MSASELLEIHAWMPASEPCRPGNDVHHKHGNNLHERQNNVVTIQVRYTEELKVVNVPAGTILGDAIMATELPLEQPCAGRGTCGQCRVVCEQGLADPDPVERENLGVGELALGTRLACRARIQADCAVTLTPVVVYSNKTFRTSNRYRRETGVPLGVAIDVGTTTVAVFLTMLDNGEVCAGAASLNGQTVYGADVISRLAAATDDPANAARMQRLVFSSIGQALATLNLSEKVHNRIERVTIVGNVVMHHLLLGYPLETLAALPFQPAHKEAVQQTRVTGRLFPEQAQVSMPPLIGGFVGSDALACLAYFGFEHPPGPILAIDLGTNGEVMVTDGQHILTASTAAGPAFEGVNITCGTRAVDGAVVSVSRQGNELRFHTIGDEAPAGLTGSGLLSLVYALRQAGVIEDNGRFSPAPPQFGELMGMDPNGIREIAWPTAQRLRLTQWDIRELQKAKAAIHAATSILLDMLDLQPADLQRIILTGSFGAEIDVEAVIGLGMIPAVRPELVETIPNGAGFGAAMFLSPDGWALAERLAQEAVQVDLDLDAEFNMRYINSMTLAPPT